METNNDARIADLEAKFETLQALVTKEATRAAERRKTVSDDLIELCTMIQKVSKKCSLDDVLPHIQAILDIHRDQIDKVHLDIEKLHEAYYHVFPDRLKQDVLLGRQLDALTSPPASDADPKKA
jgi:hypothetical protein